MRNFRTPVKSLTANEDTEKRLIFKVLHKYKQPLTRRFLSEVTGLEIATLCRALYNLTNKYKLLKVAKIKPCPKTRKWVYHYYFAKEDAQNG
jgi:uncharacterized protein YukJ